MKTIKLLLFTIDGTAIHSTRIELPEKEGIADDPVCPACLKHDWRDLYTITQHGFTEDECISILQCKDCGNMYHVQYVVSLDSPVATYLEI